MNVQRKLKLLTASLSGLNYEVFITRRVVNVGVERGPACAIETAVPTASADGIEQLPCKKALSEMRRNLTYAGDYSHGPDDGVLDSPQFANVLSRVLEHFAGECCNAVDLHTFRFISGHPHYPVFWESAFLLRQCDSSTIWISSSSD